MKFLTVLKQFSVGILTFIGFMHAQAPAPTLTAVIAQSPALYSGFLASGIGAADSSMTLSSGGLKDGTSLTGWQCFTVDVNTPNVEYICGNASGTAVSNLMRGVMVSNPNQSSSLLAYQHNRFATVDITDYPDLEIIRRQLVGLDAVNASLFYAAHPTSTASTTIEDKSYVDSTASAGAPAANTSTAGLSIFSTKQQMASGTASGTYNAVTYTLAPANQNFSSASGTNIAVVTTPSGTIADGFIGQSASDTYSFLGQVTSASTTLNGTTTLNNVFISGSTNLLLGTPIARVGTTTSISFPALTGSTSTLASLNLPLSAASTTLYHVLLTMTGNNSNNTFNSSTLQLNSGGATTTIVTIGSFSVGQGVWMFEGTIAMQNATGSEAVNFQSNSFPANGSTASTTPLDFGGLYSVNLATTTKLTFTANINSNSGPTETTTLMVYAY